jgi:tetratricopeptide (TPR) repeat protein
MLTLEERTELLVRVAELRRISAYRDLTDLLTPLSEQSLLDEPELGYSLVMAYYRMDKYDAARRLNRILTAQSRFSALERWYRKHIILEGVLSVEFGDLYAAESLFTKAMSAALRANDQWVIADATMNLGILEWIGCRWNEALGSFQRALTAHTLLGRSYSVAACHQNLAMTYRELGLGSESDSHFENAYQLYSIAESERNYELSSVEAERALLISRLGDYDRAEAMVRRAFARVSNADAPRRQAEVLRVLGIVAGKQGRLNEGRAYLEDALRLARALSIRLLEAELSEDMAALEASVGNLETAAMWAAAAGRMYGVMGAEARSSRLLIRQAALPA